MARISPSRAMRLLEQTLREGEAAFVKNEFGTALQLLVEAGQWAGYIYGRNPNTADEARLLERVAVLRHRTVRLAEKIGKRRRTIPTTRSQIPPTRQHRGIPQTRSHRSVF